LIGAHCDDIEIGMGGTLLEWIGGGTAIDVDWFVLTSTPERATEARAAAAAFLDGAVGARVTIHAFRDGFLPYDGPAVKEAFEDLKARVEPDVIFTHSRDDRHQDHRTVSDLTWNTFRNHLVLEYEIPKYDGDLGQPNAYAEVSAEHAHRKYEHLRRHYVSQADRDWFSESTFMGLMRIRGIEMRSGSGYAEGFTARKATLRPSAARIAREAQAPATSYDRNVAAPGRPQAATSTPAVAQRRRSRE